MCSSRDIKKLSLTLTWKSESPFAKILKSPMDDKVNNINRIEFEKLLKAALQNNFFNFEGKIYKQIDGVAMGSALGPTLANAFLYFHE